MYPRLIVDLNKLRENGERICAMAARAGIDRVAFVTKCFCAAPEMIRALETVPNVYLADSRLENLKRYPKTAKKKILLRLPMLSRAEEVVREADVSFCSELAALHALAGVHDHVVTQVAGAGRRPSGQNAQSGFDGGRGRPAGGRLLPGRKKSAGAG